MKSTLWKLTALTGVMGAGFLVVYQAQQNLTQSESTAEGAGDGEDFVKPDALGDTAIKPVALTSETGSPLAGQVPSENVERASASGPPAQSEPTPTLAADESAPSGYDPFSDGSQPPDGQTPEQATDEESGGANPFADLLQSFAQTPEVTEPDAEASRGAEATPAGFASIPDQSESGPVETASLNPFSTDLAETSTSEPTTESQLPQFIDEAPTSDIQSVAHEEPELPTQGEPSALTPLDPSHQGPVLIPPPVDVTSDAETGVPSLQLPESETTSQADDTMLPEDGLPNAIVQASGEREPSGSEPQNPFLMLPANVPLTQKRQADPARHAAGASNQALPVIEPQQRKEPDPFGESSPPSRADGNVILPDGTVEMTIRPRDHEESAIPNAHPPHSRSVQQPAEDFDPFGAPQQDRQPARPATVEPSRFSFGDAEPQRSQEVPSLGPPLSPLSATPPLDRRVQPAAAEMRPELDSVTPPVTPNGFDGTGTVAADAPVGTQQAQLTIEKVAPPEAVLGQPLIYSINIRNIGQSPAGNVVVKDVTPKGSRLEGTVPQAEMDEVDQKLIWRLGPMEPGELRTIRVKIVPTEARQIGSVATVSFEAAVAARTIITAPELKITMQGPEEVRVGEKAAYRFTLTNEGSADATGVFVRNLIPEGLEHPRGNDLEYDVGVLHKGQSKNIDLTLLAVAPGQYDNRVVLGAEGDISIEAQKSVSVLASRLKVHRQGPANRFVGRSARFTNTITNESSKPLQGITVVESVPVGVEFEAASEGGRFDPQNRTVTWQIPGLRPGERRQFQTMLKPTTPGEHSTTVKAFDVRRDTAEATSQLTVEGFSSLTVDVSHAGAAVPVGEEVALRLTIRNRGTAAASNVRTLVEIPRELTFVDAKGPVRHQLVGNNMIEFEALNTLEVNSEQHFDIVLVAAKQGTDARVKVQLTAAELDSPLNQEESVVIYSDRE